MRIEVTEEAVILSELDETDRSYIEHILRRTAGKSLIIPRKPERKPESEDGEALSILIRCMRTSAQETLTALRDRGFRITRATES